MKLRTGGFTVLATVCVLLLASCGGDDGGASRLILTDTGCTYEGGETFSATKTFEAELANETSKLDAFEIARIDPTTRSLTWRPTSSRSGNLISSSRRPRIDPRSFVDERHG